MSWTTPATWSVGESPTAAKMNTHIRDNLSYLYGSIPVAAIYNTSDQSVDNATWTTLAFDSEFTDTTGMHSGSDGHMTIPVTGVWELKATVPFESIASGASLAGRFFVSGAAFGPELHTSASGQDYNGVCIVATFAIAAAVPVAVQAWQNSGGAANVLGTTTGASLQLRAVSLS